MDKVISFGKGIRRLPSIGDAGELSELVNLIPKNGELVNVRPMGKSKDITKGHTLLCVHQVNGRKNYITLHEGEIYNGEISIMKVSQYKAITTIGNVIVVSDSEGLKYAIWRNDAYSYFAQSDFNFGMKISCDNPMIAYGLQVLLDNEYLTPEGGPYEYDEEKLRKLFGEIDKTINTYRDTYESENAKYKNKLFKYVCFGVAALKTYTNEYVAVSNIFTLDPVERNNGLFVRSIDKTNDCTFDVSLSGYTVNIQKSIPKGMEDIIIGVDVFLSMPVTLYDYSKGTSYKYEQLSSGGFRFPLMNATDIYKEIDSMQFYKSVSIEKEKFGNPIELERVTGAEPALDLSVISSDILTGQNIFTYNSRVNITNISYIPHVIGSSQNSQNGLGYQKIPFTTSGGRYINGFYNDAQDGYNATEFNPNKKVEAVIEVDVMDDIGGGYTNRWKGDIPYPLPPIISYPSSSAKRMRVYIKDGYKYGEFELTGLENKDLSLYINIDNDSLAYNQPYKIQIRTQEGDDSVIEDVEISEYNPNWTTTTDQDYSTQEEEVTLISNIQQAKQNVIRYSSAGNPFMFSKINSVSVGNGEIKGVSTSAKALSQGQFGQFPLYAFCSDGIWALEVAGDGSYSAKQPISRDVCNNTNSITQIDGAVVFTTDQGLKLIQGSEVALLSGQMDGHNVDEGIYFPEGFFAGYGYSEYDKLVTPPVTDDFRTILATSKIAYDYPNRLLRIYPESGQKWYVYSLESHEFSSEEPIEGGVKAVVAGYPTSLIQVGSGLYTFKNEVSDDTRDGLLLTRPIDMGEPFAMKKLQDMKLHYTKHNKEKETFVKMVVYVSNDGEHWHVLPSLRMRSFKYYRVALITKMTDNDALSGMVIRYELERTNKLR